MKFFRFLLILLSCIAFSSCVLDEDEAKYVFIGDSIISRWKLNTYFREYKTFNKGKGGSGVAYIEQNAGSCSGKIIIVHFGTNDIHDIKDENEYVQRYVKSVESLKASKTIILPIMPRGKVESAHASMTMPIIRRLNYLIEKESKARGWFFVDVFDALLDESGQYFSDIYTVDGIHHSVEGYKLLTLRVKEFM